MPEPEPKKPSKLQACARELGWHPANLVDLLRKAEWTKERFHAAIEQGDWKQQLFSEVVEASAASRVAGFGPEGFGGLTDEQILKIVPPKLRRFIERWDGRSAVLTGPTGIGKSIAAFAVVRRTKLQQARKKAQEEFDRYQNPAFGYIVVDEESRYRDGWISAADLLTAQRCHRLGEREPKDIDHAKRDSLVVVDDITWPTKDDVTRDVLASRYDRGRVTIVTAGLTKPELFQRFGDAFTRRCLDVQGERGVFIDLFEGTK